MNLQENEVIMLILSLGTLSVMIINRKQLEDLPGRNLLVSSFLFFSLSGVFTNLEGIFWESLNNELEHLSAAISAVLIAFWCYRAGKKPR